MSDHITVAMGLKKSGFEAGLKESETALDKLKGAAARFGAALGVGAIARWAHGVFRLADDTLDFAETLNVSTGFLQGWRVAVAHSGGTAEQADKAIVQLAKNMEILGLKGLDMESAILTVADAMNQTKDPVAKAEIAFDAFGKSGYRVMRAMQGGADAVRELVREAAKLDEDELAELAEIGAMQESLETRGKTEGGKALARWIQNLRAVRSGLLGAMPQLGEESSFMEKAKNSWKVLAPWFWDAQRGVKAFHEELDAAVESRNKLRREIAAERKAASDQAAADAAREEERKRELAWAKIMERTADDIEKGEKEREASAAKRRQHEEKIADAAERAAEAGRKLATFRADRGSMTLGEIATMQARTRFGAWQAAAAREVLAAEEYGTAAKAHGRLDIRDKAFAYADRIRAGIVGLSESDKNPAADLAREAAKSANELTELRKMATTGNFVVQAKGAP